MVDVRGPPRIGDGADRAASFPQCPAHRRDSLMRHSQTPANQTFLVSLLSPSLCGADEDSVVCDVQRRWACIAPLEATSLKRHSRTLAHESDFEVETLGEPSRCAAGCFGGDLAA